MGSSVTIMMYSVLLLLLGIVYWLVNKRDIFGTRANKLESAERSASSRQRISQTLPGQRSGAMDRETGAEAEVAMQVLDDLYREFTSTVRELRADIEETNIALRAESALRREVDARLAVVERVLAAPQQPEAPPVVHAPPQIAVRTAPAKRSTGQFDARYLDVFDRIQQGLMPAVIAAELGIEVDEVERVLQIMNRPPVHVQ